MELAPKQESQPAQQVELRLDPELGEPALQWRVDAAQQLLLDLRALLEQWRRLSRCSGNLTAI